MTHTIRWNLEWIKKLSHGEQTSERGKSGLSSSSASIIILVPWHSEQKTKSTCFVVAHLHEMPAQENENKM